MHEKSSELEDRIASLETAVRIQVRRTHSIAALFGVSLVINLGVIERTPFAIAQSRPTELVADHIRARAITLDDGSGRNLIHCEASQDRAQIVLTDAKSTNSIVMSVNAVGGALTFGDQKQPVARACLGFMNSTPILGLHDQQGRPRASMVVDKNGDPRLDLIGAGSGQIAIHTGPNGSTMSMIDKNGRPRCLMATTNGDPMLLLTNESGGPAVKLAYDQSVGSLVIADENKIPRVSLSHGRLAGTGIQLADEKGIPRLALSAQREFSNLSLFDEMGRQRIDLLQTKSGGSVTILRADGSIEWSPR